MNISYFTDRTKSQFNYTSHKVNGVEGAFLYTFCKEINASCVIVNDPSIPLELHAVNDLFKNHSAVLNFNIQPTLDKYLTEMGMKYLYPRRFDSLCVWVPKLKYDSSLLILYPFNKSFGCFLFFLTVFSGILWWRLTLKTNCPRELSTIYFNLIQFQMSQLSRIKLKNPFERILFVAFAFGSLIVVTCYQKLLSVLLIVPAYEPVINTISELNSSSFVILSETQNFIEFLSEAYANDSFLNRITTSETIMNDWVQFTYPNTATFDFKSNTERNLELFENFSNISLHIMSECLYSAPESYPVQRYFAFRNRLNFIIMSITESGIEQRWSTHYEQKTKNEFLSVFREHRKGLYKNNEINISHWKGVLIFCSCLWIISIIVFVVEFIYGN